MRLLKTQVVLDERSAAYIGLGIAKSSGKPAGLICTSGTAAANYFPAIVEARHSGVPMLLLTADRPPNLRNVGASQAINQIKLYGDYPVFFHEAGEPVIKSNDIRRLEIAASQAYHAAITKKGVAHVNFPFRKPLEPAPDFVKKIEEENQAHFANSQMPGTQFFSGIESQNLPKKLKRLFAKPSKPVIIDGPSGITRPNTSAVELAGILRAPLLSEFPLFSSNNLISSFDGFLKSQKQRNRLKADLIIRFGQQPVSKAIQLYLNDHADVPHIHFAELEEWQDETHSVTHRFNWNGKPVKWNLKPASIDQKWVDLWQSTEQSFNQHKKKIINRKSTLTDGAVFNWLGKRIPTRWNVFLSNSLPMSWMLFAGSPQRRTFINRGASGIDGIISTAVGSHDCKSKTGNFIYWRFGHPPRQQRPALSSKCLIIPSLW
ncbi:MAG: 2-succinyl-5-enolpyruvyl-6-hydroxy-3-cyclohexene-1-carboxylic-acid synthase [Balneolaceae bacterium]|nr:2-succinyl-5-enolpyruvyl-6-hydroxy-3-cyclohexene-1-carboxylic-acid synthase [Balneolaceae bacterium]